MEWIAYPAKMAAPSRKDCDVTHSLYSSDVKRTRTFNFPPIRLSFINVYTYPNPKPIPYNNIFLQ